MIAQYTAAALGKPLPTILTAYSNSSVYNILSYHSPTVSENKVLTHPASVDSVSTCAGQEDHVSMGGYGARKALRLVSYTTTKNDTLHAHSCTLVPTLFLVYVCNIGAVHMLATCNLYMLCMLQCLSHVHSAWCHMWSKCLPLSCWVLVRGWNSSITRACMPQSPSRKSTILSGSMSSMWIFFTETQHKQ